MRRRGLLVGACVAAAVLVLVGVVVLRWRPGTNPTGAAANAPATGNGPAGSATTGPVATASATPSAGPSASASPAPGRSAPSVFTHPGVLVSRAQLDFVRAKVQAGVQPWKSAFDELRTSRYAALSRTPMPRSTVECGSYSNPDNGCSDERTDALAAYADALMWYVTRDGRYAAKAIELMDAWSAVLNQHTNSNAPLQTGWAGAGWSRAAELIRHTYPAGWPGAGRFAEMLRNVYLPVLLKGSGSNGNWELIMTDAAMGIAVFLDDTASFNRALALWRGRVPAYIYLKSDGPAPLSPPGRPKSGEALTRYWYGQTTLVDGLAQETCRDFGHTAMGFNAAFHAAETARIQGVDLWSEQKNRFAAGLELHAGYELGQPVPSWLCSGSVTKGTGEYWEVAYDALHTRLGVNLPNTARLIGARRPMGTDNHSTGWETLTFADNPTR
jgi:Alginate lyase